MKSISKLIKILILSTIPILFTSKEMLAPKSNFIYTQPISKNKIIVLDPGHSYDEPGTGMPEERILNLKLAKTLQSKWIADGHEVYLTRTDSSSVNKYSIDYNLDKKVDLKDERLARKQIGKDKKAYYFISIHFNANKRDQKKTGMGFYIPGHWKKSKAIDNKRSFNKLEKLNYYCQESLSFTQRMTEYTKGMGIKTEIYGTDIEIVRNSNIDKLIKNKKFVPNSELNKADFPITFIIEADYLTNKKTRKFANTNKGIEYYAQTIYDAFKYAEPPKLLNNKKAKVHSIKKKNTINISFR